MPYQTKAASLASYYKQGTSIVAGAEVEKNKAKVIDAVPDLSLTSIKVDFDKVESNHIKA